MNAAIEAARAGELTEIDDVGSASKYEASEISVIALSARDVMHLSDDVVGQVRASHEQTERLKPLINHYYCG